MLTLSARVTRGPHKGRPLVLARNRQGRFVTAPAKDAAARREHASEEAAAQAVYAEGHGAWFSRDGRGGHAAFHKPRRRPRGRRAPASAAARQGDTEQMSFSMV
ncbi:hypothetical protein GCM10011390_32700 [Aureimonas endophytica]|uniref:Uncharacterized protein n=1 Tax=Aureimonas endophytica TaxID=2027858 RepID=A0A916ZSN7_9HYPH|nr:hypothetical protein [Aureimonas endophytica]GGE11122.1 hypothetical protein GCM10011390_32700 [Aureimonas endophytica]